MSEHIDDVVHERCPHCGNLYALEYTGTVDGCDVCLKLQRDKQGEYWEEGETFRMYQGRRNKIAYKVRPKYLK